MRHSSTVYCWGAGVVAEIVLSRMVADRRSGMMVHVARTVPEREQEGGGLEDEHFAMQPSGFHVVADATAFVRESEPSMDSAV
jgi:hypothetical protein